MQASLRNIASSIYSATEVEGRLFLQINDNINYKGTVERSPYFDLKEFKQVFERGEVQIMAKKATKIVLKIVFLKIELQNERNYEIEELKKQVQALENKLKGVEHLKYWEEENLDSKATFDVDCIYRIHSNSGWSLISTGVFMGTLHFNYAGSNVSAFATNRIVTKMMKWKIWFNIIPLQQLIQLRLSINLHQFN